MFSILLPIVITEPQKPMPNIWLPIGSRYTVNRLVLSFCGICAGLLWMCLACHAWAQTTCETLPTNSVNTHRTSMCDVRRMSAQQKTRQIDSRNAPIFANPSSENIEQMCWFDIFNFASSKCDCNSMMNTCYLEVIVEAWAEQF